MSVLFSLAFDIGLLSGQDEKFSLGFPFSLNLSYVISIGIGLYNLNLFY